MMKRVHLNDLPYHGNRYTPQNPVGYGSFGKVVLAIDNESRKNVAIKMQPLERPFHQFVEEEYKILKKLVNQHMNLIDFYGVFNSSGSEIWFVMEYCEGGTAINLVENLLKQNRRMNEEHIAFILKESVKALIYLHENNIIHRDVKASNILLTREGEVKLADFNISQSVQKSGGIREKCHCLGSPGWMAPEIADGKDCDFRADVWALGIVAIEMGDGRNPFQDMHPTRALFQISCNPPPTLYRMSNWTENYNDFISECLVKNFEHRPFMQELMDHPFLSQIPENNYHLSLEIKSLLPSEVKLHENEVTIFGNYLKKGYNNPLQEMTVEDLASLGEITEDSILNQLKKRYENGDFQTFIGDVLLVLNPFENKDNFEEEEYHEKYQRKSRSDNAPHIYSIADTAYQNALHHAVPQRIVLSGESGSGKTTNYLYLIDHLLFLGRNINVNANRIKNAIKLIHSLTHATTLFNNYSTRAILKTNIFFGNTGKVSAAGFHVHCLEKCRISSVDLYQGNFHILYYIYDGLKAQDDLEKFKLKSDREDYRYLRISGGNRDEPRNDITKNKLKYDKLINYFKEFEFTDDQITTIQNIIAAILNLGNIRFEENDNLEAELQNRDILDNVAELLSVDKKRFKWALMNSCIIQKGTAIKKRKTCDQARDSRDVLANNLYCRLVDYIISFVNNNLAIGKTIFGSKYVIKILDYYGFECFQTNHLDQLFVNCFNEQMHYHFLQRFFSWEVIDTNGEDVPYTPIQYYDNKSTLDYLLGKPEGVFSFIDDASKKSLSSKYILDFIHREENNYINIASSSEFTVAHYAGRVTYNVKEMPDKNRDYLSPEIIETLRSSENEIIEILFSNVLNKTGNLQVDFVENKQFNFPHLKKVAETNQFCQIKKARTSISIYRALSLEMLKDLSIGGSVSGIHYVKCIRTNLKNDPKHFHKELVKQQIRALAIVETAKSRQLGYSFRIPFSEFLRRYKFLAFDFHENVEINKDNCRLLLIRLKMEGWVVGKSKVFLKYYNEEYLARLYDNQVLKIIKIQSILRKFLIKCRIAKKAAEIESECVTKIQSRRQSVMTEEEAAEIIQKAYRKSTLRKNYESFSTEFEPLDEEQHNFIKPFVYKWKRKSIFGVLLRYRAHKIQDFFNFCQQVHLYNLNAFHNLSSLNQPVELKLIDPQDNLRFWFGESKPIVMKLPFRLDEIPFYDTSLLSHTNTGSFIEKEEPWDSPYSWKESKMTPQLASKLHPIIDTIEGLPLIPFQRDPLVPIKDLPPPKKDYQQSKNVQFQDSADKFNQRKMELRKFDQDEAKFTAPANKDFDYIKPKPVASKLPKSADPIAELRNIVRRGSGMDNDDDEPPFNFRAMLRKTNFQRDSLKRAPETSSNVRRYSFTKSNLKIASTNGLQEDEMKRSVSLDLGNGLILEGTEVEL